MDVIHGLDAEASSNLCRVCATPCNLMPHYRVGEPGSENSSRLKIFLGINVEKERRNEFYPKIICSPCFAMIDHWKELYDTAQRSSKFFSQQSQINGSGSSSSNRPADVMVDSLGEIFNLNSPNCKSLPSQLSKETSFEELVVYEIENPAKIDNAEPAPSNASAKYKKILPKLKIGDMVQFSSPKFPCLQLKENVEGGHSFTEHFKMPQEFLCGECGSKFEEISLLLSHMASHKDSVLGKEASCFSCAKSFESKKGLVDHLLYCQNAELENGSNTNENEQNYTCGTCHKTYLDFKSFANHFPEKHARFYELSCGVCRTNFKKLPHLLRHEQDHRANPDKILSFGCKHCPRRFSSRKNQHQHVMKRHRDKPLGRMYYSEGDLNTILELQNFRDCILPASNNADCYQCGACREIFDSIVDFGKHFPIEHEIFRQMPCGVCGAKFNKLPLLLRHEQNHKTQPEKKITFPCRVCNKMFNGVRNVRHHMRYCHKDHILEEENKIKKPVPMHSPNQQENSYRCKLCPMNFYKLSELSEHSVEHISNNCGACEEKFSTREDLKKHLAALHPDFQEQRVFPCPVCGKDFKSKQTMKVHTELHSDERNFVCEICAKTYRTHSTLCKHKAAAHANGPRFMCHICARTFTFKLALKRHVMLHLGELPHKCTFCSRRFGNAQRLDLHVQKNHEGGASNFSCFNCNKCFRNTRNWRRHMINVCKVPASQIPCYKNRHLIKRVNPSSQ